MATFLVAALLLAVERAAYLWIWHRPEAFRRATARLARASAIDPVTLVYALFCVFKVVQIGVFGWWCYVFGGGVLWPSERGPIVALAGGGLIVAGQFLNVSVFRRLGVTGVFYGSRFGHVVPWSHAFPFSWFKHPQYLGTVLSIWGVFLCLRFPNADWVALPLLQTVYYGIGARFEQ